MVFVCCLPFPYPSLTTVALLSFRGTLHFSVSTSGPGCERHLGAFFTEMTHGIKHTRRWRENVFLGFDQARNFGVKHGGPLVKTELALQRSQGKASKSPRMRRRKSIERGAVCYHRRNTTARVSTLDPL